MGNKVRPTGWRRGVEFDASNLTSLKVYNTGTKVRGDSALQGWSHGLSSVTNERIFALKMNQMRRIERMIYLILRSCMLVMGGFNIHGNDKAIVVEVGAYCPKGGSRITPSVTRILALNLCTLQSVMQSNGVNLSITVHDLNMEISRKQLNDMCYRLKLKAPKGLKRKKHRVTTVNSRKVMEVVSVPKPTKVVVSSKTGKASKTVKKSTLNNKRDRERVTKVGLVGALVLSSKGNTTLLLATLIAMMLEDSKKQNATVKLLTKFIKLHGQTKRGRVTNVASPKSKAYQGVYVELNGKLDGARRTMKKTIQIGRMPLSTVNAGITFSAVQAKTTNGTIGVKVTYVY